MKRPKPLEVKREDIQALRDRAKRGELSVSAEDAALIESLAETVVVLSEAVEKKGTSIRRLLNMLFGSRTESRRRLFGNKPDDDADPPAGPAGRGSSASVSDAKPRPQGHGRNGVQVYSGAERVSVKHAELKLGAPCPDCRSGKLRELDPSRLVHVRAQPPVTATIYECQRLRCNTCGKVFSAPAPPAAAQRKYDRSVGILIALLKYGNGMPFARLENLERMAGKQLLRAHAGGLTPPRVMEHMAGIQMLDVLVPTTTGQWLSMSRYTQPDKTQRLLISLLGLDLPPQPPPKITPNMPVEPT